MLSKTPTVTVLMTAFNAEHTIRESVASILAQTFADFEVLIVDDGSTDKTAERILEFRDDRVRLHQRHENRGQTASLNEGLAVARGRYVARQDADDYSHHRRLERQVGEFDRQDDLVLLGTQGVVCNTAGKITSLLTMPLSEAEVLAWFRMGNPVIHTAAMFRTEVVRELGGYNERFAICQDYELWARLKSRGAVRNLRCRSVAYTLSDASLSHSSGSRTEAEAQEVRSWLINSAPIAFKPGSRFRVLDALRAEEEGGRLSRLWRAFWRAPLFTTALILETAMMRGQPVNEWMLR